MNFSLYPVVNKRAAIFNMSQGDKTFQALLDDFSTKELTILKKHSDLLDKVRWISKLNLVQILAELKDEYDLEIDTYHNGDYFISTEKLEDAIPDWFQSNHCGWFKGPAEFEVWARSLLVQEVRINIWIRYCEHKKNPKSTPSYGMYL